MNEHSIRRSMKADGYSDEYIERITDDLADYRLQEQRDRESAEALDKKAAPRFYVWHDEGQCNDCTDDLEVARRIEKELLHEGHDAYITDADGNVIDETCPS